ncbi:MAG TPA: MMPL family transporter [Streptosporangiaceae bacterium]|nr:MMPL family transporter [Streptosporangiaceae bacterium]
MHIDAIFGAIGRWSVRLRWLVVLAWVVGAVAAVTQLPSLSSVTQSNNAKFLPASAPSQHALDLAAPFGNANLIPVPVIAATSSGPLTPGDVRALTSLQHTLTQVPGVKRVADVGRSANGQAEQLLALASMASSGNPNYAEDLVDGLRAKISAAGLPSGLRVHLAGDTAVQVDEAKASGSTGSKVQNLSLIFIIVLLVLIFRSLTLALTTVAPALMAVVISGPLVAEAAKHGLQVSPLAQYLMIVLVLGAGTDYGLFLVFRTREELRRAGHDMTGMDGAPQRGLLRTLAGDVAGSRPAARTALVEAVTRVGESITFSAATVIAAVLTLLAASFPFYSNLGIPFAIAIGVTLLAGLTLLPALLSIRLSILAIKRTLFQAVFGRPKLLPWSIQGKGGTTGMWGRVAGRIVRKPAATLAIGVIGFGALALGVLGYTAAGFGGSTAPPSGSDSAAGSTLLTRYFPESAANPTTPIFRFSQPVWTDPQVLARATAELQHSSEFTQVAGPLNPAGAMLAPATFASLHAALGPAKLLPPAPPPGSTVPPAQYQAYRATANFISQDGRTVQFSVGLRAGDPGSTEALNAVPAIRAEVTRIGTTAGAADSAVGGEAPALYDISSVSNSDLAKVIPIAIIAIGILLALVLRSLVAPLYLIASVGLSYLAALGLSVLVFIEIAGDKGLVFFLPFLMFIFLLALGEDYNILVMTRIREEAHRLPLREAVTRAIGVTGTTVTSAGLVLAGTFVVFGLVAGGQSGGSQFRDIALGLALGILMDTFLVRTLLVPSTVVLLGRWNWWPSRLRGAGQAGAPDEPAGGLVPGSLAAGAGGREARGPEALGPETLTPEPAPERP